VWNKVRVDLSIAIGFFLALMATAIYINSPTPVAGNMEFGYEYGNIADALARGDGFADPFRADSGPTAWMPPAYPVLIAGIYEVFGARSIPAAWCLLVFKYLGFSLSLFLLLRAAERLPFPQHRRVGIPLLFIVMFAFYRDLVFLSMTDSWMHFVLGSAIIHALGVALYSESAGADVYLGALGALAPMSNPILSFAAVIVLAASLGRWWWRRERIAAGPGLGNLMLRRVAVFAACFAVTTSAWTYRNYKAFGSLILVKSNLAFDYYQANFMDEDGVISHSTLRNFHPIAPNPQRDAYIQEGEAAFLKDYKSRVPVEMRKAGAAPLMRKALNRAWNALVFTQDPADLEPENAVAGLRAVARKGKTFVKGVLVAGAPFLALLICLADPVMRRNPVFFAGATAYVADLAPHVLVSHYERYQEPLAVIQIIFLYAALSKLSAVRMGVAPQTQRHSDKEAVVTA
jgi:hypothetical protein